MMACVFLKGTSSQAHFDSIYDSLEEILDEDGLPSWATGLAGKARAGLKVL